METAARLAALVASLAGPAVARAAIDETTPSRAVYFDWINSEWPGTDEAKTLANMAFFRHLHDEYGMRLDHYLLDAGNLDRSRSWIPRGEEPYGTLDDERFRRKFPRGLGPLVEAAAGFGARLGMWLGPDGWGDSEAEARRRTDTLVRLCRDHRVGLFKFDAAATAIRPEKSPLFAAALRACRQHVPDLLVINHRIRGLDAEALAQTNTYLWEGRETYIDVHIWNETTAPHGRAGALARGLPPGLGRLAEDHGVCLSSVMEGWEDDLVLQAFNRSLILAPEIYGNPWLLADRELPRLARLFNLHRAHRELLVRGQVLPPERFGPHAVSRGDGRTRLVTLRNPGWTPVRRTLPLDAGLGLDPAERFEVRRLHPSERRLGLFPHGAQVEVEVPPYRAVLVRISADRADELALEGVDHEVVRDVPGRPVEVLLLGPPGGRAAVRLTGARRFGRATLDGEELPALAAGEPVAVRFPGRAGRLPFHRRLGVLAPAPVPPDAEALFEAASFAADNDALEVRSLRRAGPTAIPEVEAARRAFFEDPSFWHKGIWDRYAFDGDEGTAFAVRAYRLKDVAVRPGAFRLDLGRPARLDEIVLRGVPEDAAAEGAEVSADLRRWRPVAARREDGALRLRTAPLGPVRYLRLPRTPLAVAEAEGRAGGRPVSRARWRASNLFPLYAERPATAAWTGRFRVPEAAPGAFLAVAIPGAYGAENAWAALRVGGRLVGAPARSPSFPSNHFEHAVHRAAGHYTYHFPLTPDLVGRPLEVVVLGFAPGFDGPPEVWLTAPRPPAVERRLVLRD